jgi:pyrroloquinoline quinone (PQQ) biosynthesis protein C
VIVDPWKKTFAKGAAVSYSYEYQLPSSSGSYGNSVAFYNAKDQILACVSITYKF